ncbi:hypothetical protein [Brevinema andersonii]|uniref:hypothetical protein n=1 Tax=Brevinema andersonii TaxID=34097 RepID=UPI0013566E08|nr:hypothetical protein [Brevinema andersonii]
MALSRDLNTQTFVNASTLNSVNISDSMLQDIGSISKVWKTFLDRLYVFDKNNTIQYTFDIKERVLTKKVISSGTPEADIYYRIKIY